MQIFSLRGLSAWGQTNISVGKFDSDEHYVDSNPDYPEESRHEVSSLRFRAVQKFFQRNGNQYTITTEGAEHRIESDNTGDQTERQAAMGLLSTFKPTANTSISPSIRADWNSSQIEIVPTGSLALLQLFNVSVLKSLRVNMGTSYRFPTINELYWTDVWGMSIGNPDLLPEEGRSASAELTLEPLSSILTTELRVYHFLTENLIQWTADENWVWSPQNIARSESFGASLQLNIQPEKLPIQASIRSEQNQSRILSTGTDQGKRLIYVPAVSHWLDLSCKTSRLAANLNYRFLGKRRYSYSSTEELEAYKRWDASVSFILAEIGKVIPVLELGARNLADKKDVQSVYGYTEPGRALFGQLTLKFR
jgi:outer membrane cobalamin receptor